MPLLKTKKGVLANALHYEKETIFFRKIELQFCCKFQKYFHTLSGIEALAKPIFVRGALPPFNGSGTAAFTFL